MDDDIARTAQAPRSFSDSAQDRQKVRRGGGDHAEHFPKGGLLLKCFRQFIGALLQFLEEPRILDRDHSLVRKSLQ